MNTHERSAMQQALEDLIESARLLGSTQAIKGYGYYTEKDAMFERVMYESIAKHKATLLEALESDEEAKDTAYMLGFSDGKQYAHKYEQPVQEDKCSDHPDAPHGFDRNASHSMGRYVCECEGWSPEQPVSQEPVGIVEASEEWGIAGVLTAGLPIGTKLYTAQQPVKEAELTDDEIRFWIGRFPFLLNEESEKWMIGFVRAVIAAYKEKQK